MPAPAVIYAAKSSEDVHGSIPTQLADCRAACEREGRQIVAEEQDEAKSAYSSSRGHGLARAKAAAVRAAAEHGAAELWVQHSDRLARGDGLSADHLAEIYFAMRRASVRLRSVQDDSNLEDVIRVALMGERNHEDSKRKSDATRDGKRRSAERGDPPSTVPDGYRALYEHDAAGKVIGRRWAKHPDRGPVFELIFRLALEGWSDRAIVLELDRHGYKTAPIRRDRKPRPFDANRIRQTLTCPTYAGLVIYQGKVLDDVRGRWPAFVSPEDFARIRAMRNERITGGPDRLPPGRPPLGYVLARVATCGACGSPMDVVTVRYVRKDGTRAKRYVCRVHRERPQDCSAAVIDAELVDLAFTDNLTSFLGDVAGWRDRLVQGREAERAKLRGEVGRASQDFASLERAVERIGAAYAGHVERGETEDADAVREVLKGKRFERNRAELRLQAAETALADVAGDDEPIDPLLDFYGGLQAELSGRVQSARGDVARLNAATREFFAEVRLTSTDEGVEVLPVLSVAAVERILARPGLWPHEITATIAGRPATVIDPDAMIRERFARLLERDPEAAAALIERLRARQGSLESSDRHDDDGLAVFLTSNLSTAEIDALLADADGAELRIDVAGPPVMVASEAPQTPPLRRIRVLADNPQLPW